MLSKNKKIIVIITAILALCISFSIHYNLTPFSLFYASSRILVDHILSYVHEDELIEAKHIVKSYYIGITKAHETPQSLWEKLEVEYSFFKLLEYTSKFEIINDIPFVYIKPNVPPLLKLKEEYHLDDIVKSGKNEFEKMMLLAKWLGTRWDHGTDSLPGIPKTGSFNPSEVIKAGEHGKRFWCDIAAETAILAAAAMGWPARLITLSRDGYKWEHAVAEFWSNDFEKWFLVDTDFNVIFEYNSVPLSAYELCHYGPELQKSPNFKISRFAPPKPSLKNRDLTKLLPLFKYVHVDMRNDWIVRELSRGSPAGGDFATWWTARPDLGPILTGKIKVDKENRFNWPVNITEIYPISFSRKQEYFVLTIGLRGYSPYFASWFLQIDDSSPILLKKKTYVVELNSGKHTIEAKMLLFNNNLGPPTKIAFLLSEHLKHGVH